MHRFLLEQKPVFSQVLDWTHNEIQQIRTGRAHPGLVESIPVEAYGSTMEMKGVASINSLDARTLAIEPWDKTLLKAIESSIQKADIGIQPVVDGSMIRLTVPALTEETRRQMVKLMKERLEEGKVRIRSVREKTREQILNMEKVKEINEDEKFKLFEELDEMTRQMIEEIEQMGKQKEEEIMTI
ncbi:ribosome recycling factor [Candidatus Uhrbacteria bacterium CG_4_9_14_3_um_filter_36_7]|uniref:Ribosome-recycling factor n=1 Tax=Candidatus Uhrbacteria bacterium CG_4_9_14_3_um_filter_36_7 TaxID=1975033 RepID=A0A2M7XHU6_9BACT|nr:MAG: ribosome recycling factor [Candidatus Uhrbacteria bacterium CG_4_9_14_3_um_filter_36_7]